jgi:hypothetical protein
VVYISNKVEAVIYNVMFCQRRPPSYKSLKWWWIVFELLKIMILPFSYSLALQKKLAPQAEIRTTHAGIKVYIWPAKMIIQEVSQMEYLAAQIITEPGPQDIPTEVYKSLLRITLQRWHTLFHAPSPLMPMELLPCFMPKLLKGGWCYELSSHAYASILYTPMPSHF